MSYFVTWPGLPNPLIILTMVSAAWYTSTYVRHSYLYPWTCSQQGMWYNTVTQHIYYWNVKNVKNVISRHNRKILGRSEATKPATSCKCRYQDECPIDNKCQAESIVYQRRLGDYTGMHCVSLLFTIAIFEKRLVKSCWNILRFLSLKISFFRRYVFIFVLLKNLIKLFLTCLVQECFLVKLITYCIYAWFGSVRQWDTPQKWLSKNAEATFIFLMGN
jgi:hypothetical protein